MENDILDQFFEQENEARKEADEKVTPEQACLKPGDFCVRNIAYLAIPIYSEILDAAACFLDGRKPEDLNDEELDEYKSTVQSYQEESMRFYRFTKSYSYMCPYGELGDIHVSTVTKKISKEEFLKAQANGWREF